MKKFLITVLILVVCVALYFKYISDLFGTEETYYAKIPKDHSHVVDQLVPEDNDNDVRYYYDLGEDATEFKKDDYVKVVFTDNKGVRVSLDKVAADTLPKAVKQKLD